MIKSKTFQLVGNLLGGVLFILTGYLYSFKDVESRNVSVVTGAVCIISGIGIYLNKLKQE